MSLRLALCSTQKTTMELLVDAACCSSAPHYWQDPNLVSQLPCHQKEEESKCFRCWDTSHLACKLQEAWPISTFCRSAKKYKMCSLGSWATGLVVKSAIKVNENLPNQYKQELESLWFGIRDCKKGKTRLHALQRAKYSIGHWEWVGLWCWQQHHHYQGL